MQRVNHKREATSYSRIHGQGEWSSIEVLGSRQPECAQVRQHVLPGKTFFFLSLEVIVVKYVERNQRTKRSFIDISK